MRVFDSFVVDETEHRLREAIWRPSYNIGRPGSLKKPKRIVLHSIANQTTAGAVHWLCSKASKASAHLVLGRAGEIIQLVPFDTVAWHARVANKNSIGIELDNPGPLYKVNGVWRSLVLGTQYNPEDVVEMQHPCSWSHWCGWLVYSQPQQKLAREVCRILIEQYPTIKEIVSHAELEPGRAYDPGPAWDMESLRTSVFGRV